ncbi:MAG: DUF3786 domain-containing protein [Desulfobacterales bacterium]|nr:DUF3786 domain-containing protein [Desulfobacterales bacterium]
MTQFNNAMEIFKLLNKSNCRQCLELTCLAFAGAVYTRQKQLSECPHLSSDILEKYKNRDRKAPIVDQNITETMMDDFKREIRTVDLEAKAAALGCVFSQGRMTVKVLGKNVSIDSQGNVFTDIHVNPRVIMPLFNYIIQGSAKPISGNWVPFWELPHGRAWKGLFVQQCEIVIKKIADNYPHFFEEIIRLFNGKQIENHYQADITLVLYPLPKIPFLICYWLPEEGIDSELHLFFDASAEDFLTIESLYSIGAGLARMFEKITLRHGVSD